ncbi:hypothetical protein GOEFS_049_00060 [Gordonia effusa NBRC 100432]|uniref:Uncharacterized protein n=1 Tax=Gordonia effusa NBRC 100432 TaxID=1077974 RepID=H0QZD4_9ACTN|nr:hypothetical protein [Gordonia effusa]GAB18185.1 hypothetical protein GOEFS_049_00060 [Gordonia effusa NBRC 100432]
MSEDDATTTEPTVVEAPREVVATIRGFVSREGGEATAVIAPIGAAGVRITLVGKDGGILGDRVVPDVATAEAVVNAVDGLSVGEWDRELVSSTTVKPSHYRQMAGWVARQRRFPKARNRASL